MIIYIADYENNKVLEEEFGDVLNLEQFNRELDELYPLCWFDNELDAINDLKVFNFDYDVEF